MKIDIQAQISEEELIDVLAGNERLFFRTIDKVDSYMADWGFTAALVTKVLSLLQKGLDEESKTITAKVLNNTFKTNVDAERITVHQQNADLKDLESLEKYQETLKVVKSLIAKLKKLDSLIP